MSTKKEDLVILVNLEDCVTSVKQKRPKIGVHGGVLGYYKHHIPDKLFNPLSHNLFEGSLLIDTCDLKDCSPYSLGTKEWTGVIERGVFENLNPDRVLRYMDRFNRADTLYDVDLYILHKRYAVNLIKKGDLYYKLDADAPYTGPIYHVHWGETKRYDFLHEDGDGGLKEVHEQINAELGERIELFKDEYDYFNGVGGNFFRLTVEKAGQFKNGKLEGTYKEYERDCYNPDIEYVSANYSYHQGLLDGITSLSWLGDRGCDYHTYETIEYTNGFKNGFQKHYQRDIDEDRICSYIYTCKKFKNGKLTEEIHDEETLRKLFPDEFCMELRHL